MELKKDQVQNMDLKKAGCKKQGDCYSNREEARLFGFSLQGWVCSVSCKCTVADYFSLSVKSIFYLLEVVQGGTVFVYFSQ